MFVIFASCLFPQATVSFPWNYMKQAFPSWHPCRTPRYHENSSCASWLSGEVRKRLIQTIDLDMNMCVLSESSLSQYHLRAKAVHILLLLPCLWFSNEPCNECLVFPFLLVGLTVSYARNTGLYVCLPDNGALNALLGCCPINNRAGNFLSALHAWACLVQCAAHPRIYSGCLHLYCSSVTCSSWPCF